METPEIVYEDDALLAVNKPAGMVMHRAFERDVGFTLADWVAERYPEMREVGEALTKEGEEDIHRSGIVHRLDRDTSGIVVLAKTGEVFEHLKEQFQNREIEKEYRAIVYGVMKDNEGRVDVPLARKRGDFRRVSTSEQSRGPVREAITDYRVLSRGEGFSYVAAFPKTGRTHQIRAHMKHINHPVVCDAVYAPKKECPNPPGRLALHALALSFTHPDGSRMRLEAPIAEDVRGAVSHLLPELQG